VRVIVTRAEAQAEPLAEELRRLGHEPVLCPLIRVEPLGDGPIDAGGYDWLVLTSANGAAELARRLAGRPQRIAAVGPGTAERLRAAGLAPDLVPRVSTQEGLLAELPRPVGRVLLAAAEGARRLLVDELGADFVPLYRTLELTPDDPPAGDVVVLASASAARAWARIGTDTPAVTIGPQTTEAARDAGIDVVAEAGTHDLAGLVAAVASLPGRWHRSSPS
jgi:uroporphyrinogen III methyltransferase / synthase